MLISFELTMPSRNSWNGRWSGQDKKYYIVKSFVGKKRQQRMVDLIKSSTSYSHFFGDGWVAAVTLEIISKEEARKRRKISAGFCGYNWMVDSIINTGEITCN